MGVMDYFVVLRVVIYLHVAMTIKTFWIAAKTTPR